jgi:activator of HSP90 ATPase
MKGKVIRQSITIKSTPDKVYKAFMDSRTHSRFTGGKAKMSSKIGGEFSAYDGYATGKNLELVPNEIIRQSWRANDWPGNHISEIRLELEPTHLGTRITFTHKGVPEKEYESLKNGWTEYYWEPLKQLLNEE